MLQQNLNNGERSDLACVCLRAAHSQRWLYSVHKQPQQQQQNRGKQPGVQPAHVGSIHVCENTNAFIGSLKKTKICLQMCTFNVTQVQWSVLAA